MGARGYNIAEEAHVVQMFPPGTVSGGVTGQVFSMGGAAKANIIINWGATAAVEGAVSLSACTDISGDNPVPIAFDLYQQVASGPGNDIQGPRQAIPVMGYIPLGVANTVDILHVQADYLPYGYRYLRLTIADGTNADNASAIAVLSGLRNAGVSNPTATV